MRRAFLILILFSLSLTPRPAFCDAELGPVVQEITYLGNVLKVYKIGAVEFGSPEKGDARLVASDCAELFTGTKDSLVNERVLLNLQISGYLMVFQANKNDTTFEIAKREVVKGFNFQAEEFELGPKVFVGSKMVIWKPPSTIGAQDWTMDENGVITLEFKKGKKVTFTRALSKGRMVPRYYPPTELTILDGLQEKKQRPPSSKKKSSPTKSKYE